MRFICTILRRAHMHVPFQRAAMSCANGESARQEVVEKPWMR